jgi:hypothetical protein
MNYGSGFSSQYSAEHLKQAAELSALRNSSLGPLAASVLAIALARRPAATACAAVQPTPPLLGRWRPAGLAAPGPRSALTGILKLGRDCHGSPHAYRGPASRCGALADARDDLIPGLDETDAQAAECIH